MKLQRFFNKQKRLPNFLFVFSPILKFRIKENSMSPFLNSENLILISRISYLFAKPKLNEVVVIKNPIPNKHNKKYLVKRIERIENNKFFVTGDNLKESIDSRNFGFISKNDIVGKMIYKI